MNHFKLFCLVIGIFFLVSCSQATPVPPTATPVPPTPVPPTATPLPTPSVPTEDFLGIWLVGGAYCQFREDDTYSCAFAKNDLDSAPFDAGTYERDDTQLILTQTVGPCVDIPGEYEIELINDGAELQVKAVDDPCEDRPLEKYSPFKKWE